MFLSFDYLLMFEFVLSVCIRSFINCFFFFFFASNVYTQIIYTGSADVFLVKKN